MKFFKNIKQNEIDIDESIKTEENSVFNQKNLSDIPLSFYQGPLNNKNTYKKDLLIIQNYAEPIVSFFKNSGCSTLPYFTSRMEPKTVKRIVVDKTITVDTNQELKLLIQPFTLACMMWNTTGTNTVIHASALEAFLHYRVVVAKLTIKQVGIMYLTDTYGTIMDAAVVPPTLDMDFLKENVLNIQNAPGKSVMGVDGRIGIQANFVGSDLYPVIPTNPKYLTAPEICMAGPTIGAPIYIPFGSKVANISGEKVNIKKADGTDFELLAGSFTTMVKAAVGATGPLAYEQPTGEALFIRVTPPSTKTSFKIYLDMVIEGQVKDEYTTNMPQIVPSFCFDFQRIKYAVQNIIPSIIMCPRPNESSLGTLLPPPIFINMKEEQVRKPKGSKYKDGTTPPNPPKNGEKQKGSKYDARTIPPNPSKIDQNYKEDPYDEKMRKLPKGLKNKAKYFKETLGFSQDDVLTFYEKDGQVPDNKRDELTKVMILFDFPDASDEDVNIDEDEYAIAMNSEEDIKQIKEQKKKENQVITAMPRYKMKGNAQQTIKPEMPGYLKDAVDFALTNLAEKYQQTDTNRLFKDATLPTPDISYQYFPIVGEKTQKVSPALVIVAQTASTEHSLSIKTIDYEGNDKEIEIYYEPTDFSDYKVFLKDLQIVVSFAFKNNLHYSDTPSLTIRMFAPGKVTGRSYMYALLLAFYGAPSGGYYSGSFDLQDDQYIATPMDKKVISLKAASTTLLCPLVIMAKDENDAAFTNIVSGIVPKQEDGKLITTDNPYIGLIYGLLPFNARLYRETPFKGYSLDIKKYLMSSKSDLYRKYILALNLKDPDKITKFLENDEVSWQDFQKSSLPRFSGIAINKKKYMVAKDFYDKYPEMLNDDRLWHFKFGDNLFVDRNIFKAHIRETGERYIKDFEKKIGTDWRVKLYKVKDIKNTEFKTAMDNLKKGFVDNPFKKLSEDLRKAEFKYQQDEDSDESKLWSEIEKLSKPFYNVLDRMANFIASNKGTKKYSRKISQDSRVGSALNLVSLTNDIALNANPEDEPAIAFFIKVCEELGPNAIQTMAYACNWPHTKSKPNLKVNTLKLFRDYLKKAVFPEDEVIEERPRYKSANKKNIKSNISRKKFIYKKDEEINPNQINLENLDIDYESNDEQ